MERILTEEGDGHIVEERTSNTYMTATPVVHITCTAVPEDQDPANGELPGAVTTIEETF
jgi:hypothetical protein